MTNIEWATVRDNHRDFIVTERSTHFEVRPCKRGSRRRQLAQLVYWSSEDARKAQDWLRAEALRDRTKCTCKVCEFTGFSKMFYAYLAGYYCSEKCYDTLFADCLECGQRNMTALTNSRPNASKPERGGPENQLCDKCHAKKHNWCVVTLGIGPFRR